VNLQDPIAELEHGDDLPVASDECRILPAPSNPMATARELIAHRHHENGALLLRHWRGSWMEWHRGVWTEVEERTVRAHVYRQTEHAVYLKETEAGEELPKWAPTRHKVVDLLEAMAAVAHLPHGVQPPTWIEGASGAAQIVVCRNGMLDVASRSLRAHDPRYFTQVGVPFDFDQDAARPSRWYGFLEQLWPDDPDAPRALQEFMGYVLSGRTDLDKILLLIGPTRAGKGVIARVFGLLIGPGNVSGPTLASLGQNFGLQDLIGKPLAVISDARLGHADTHQVVERLLAISGRDTLTVDRKYRDPWTGQLPTKFMIVSNELPRFGDASGAITNRFVVLALTESWLGREDRELEAALAAELPGILNWALDGLDRLAEQDRFTEPTSSVDAITSLADLVSPVAAFVRDDCVRGAHLHVGCEELYADWKRWAEDNGHRAGSTQTFSRDLRAVIPGLRITRPRDDENEHRPRRYGGIGRRMDQQCPEPRTSADQQPHDDLGPQWSAVEAFVVRTPGSNGDREVVVE
jgi:putative DNA primase/helicase